MSRSEVHRVVLYTADAWEHVCPLLRVVAPVEKAGVELLRGNEWKDENLEVDPELVAEADVVVVQRDFPYHEEAYANVMQEAKSHGKPVIYDLDDLLFELPNSHPDIDIYKSSRFPILKAVVEADTVTTASEFLRDYLKEFNPNTHLLPNYLDEDIWSR